MSRSGYNNGIDNWQLIKWRGQVASAIRGKRGQALLRDLVWALDNMPRKELVAGALQRDGNVCAIGAVGVMRGVDMSKLDPDDSETVAYTFDIADPLAREIVFENDENGWNWKESRTETPAERWRRMRAWAVALLKKEAAE